MTETDAELRRAPAGALAGGTGLGVYGCRELGRRLDGQIWVDSAEGEGSTLFFELPLADV